MVMACGMVPEHGGAKTQKNGEGYVVKYARGEEEVRINLHGFSQRHG